MDYATIRDAARSIARAELAVGAAQRDRDRAFPRDGLAALGRNGYFGILVPRSFGGSELDHVALITAIEEVAAADAVCSTILASQNSLANMILLELGSPEQKKDYLPDFASGRKICAFALSEPQSGSDAFRMTSRAIRNDGGYVLSGCKQFVTAGKEADYAIVFARTDPDKPKDRAFSAFLLPTDVRGYNPSKHEETFGLRAADTRQVQLEGVHVPFAWRLGEEGAGYDIATRFLEGSRLAIAAQSVGIARAAMEQARDYALQREAFGKPIIMHQACMMRLADMATSVHTARVLVTDAARRVDAGAQAKTECLMAKLFSTEMAERVTHDAMQILGGYGYLNDFPLERFYRDARVGTIYEGTSDIIRLLIGNEILQESRR